MSYHAIGVDQNVCYLLCIPFTIPDRIFCRQLTGSIRRTRFLVTSAIHFAAEIIIWASDDLTYTYTNDGAASVRINALAEKKKQGKNSAIRFTCGAPPPGYKEVKPNKVDFENEVYTRAQQGDRKFIQQYNKEYQQIVSRRRYFYAMLKQGEHPLLLPSVCIVEDPDCATQYSSVMPPIPIVEHPTVPQCDRKMFHSVKGSI